MTNRQIQRRKEISRMIIYHQKEAEYLSKMEEAISKYGSVKIREIGLNCFSCERLEELSEIFTVSDLLLEGFDKRHIKKILGKEGLSQIEEYLIIIEVRKEDFFY